MEDFKTAIHIYRRLKEKEITTDDIEGFELFNSANDTKIAEILDLLDDEFATQRISSHRAMYLIPKVTNNIDAMNYSKYKELIPYKNATLVDQYLMFYIIMNVLNEIYSGQNNERKSRDFITRAELLQRMDERVEMIIAAEKEDMEAMQEEEMYSQLNIIKVAERWDNMISLGEDKKFTKQRLIKNIHRKMAEEGLISNIDDKFQPTEKLDTIMENYFLHTDRLIEIDSLFENEVI
jgi:hypothetical protein